MSYSEMHDETEFESSEFRSSYPSLRFVDPEKHPVIATVNVIAAELLGILGPMLWAALIVLFLMSEFSSN